MIKSLDFHENGEIKHIEFTESVTPEQAMEVWGQFHRFQRPEVVMTPAFNIGDVDERVDHRIDRFFSRLLKDI